MAKEYEIVNGKLEITPEPIQPPKEVSDPVLKVQTLHREKLGKQDRIVELGIEIAEIDAEIGKIKKLGVDTDDIIDKIP
jgi:hypothetical protein